MSRRCINQIVYQDFMTTKALARKPSAIRALQPLIQIPGMISLGGGMPNPSTFPISSLNIGLTTGETIQLDKSLLEKGLQYSPTPGVPELVTQLMNLQLREHQPPELEHTKRSICITTGSQDAISKAFDMLLDQEDTLLLEDPTYSGSLAHLYPLQCKLKGIPTDEHGLQPNELDRILSSWDERSMGKRPKVLYTIPTGSNPTGGSMTEDRKRQVYEIASRKENNLIILEDDPYYYLRLDGTRSKSLFGMDVDGRVLRFDSLSKIISSGLRIGFATGPAPLIDRINLHTQSTNLHCCGVAQVITYALLKEWGEEGWNHHLKRICKFYQSQRNEFLRHAQTHLTGLAEWNHPEAGMFVWMRLLGVKNSQELIEERAVKNKVLLVPGNVFLPSGEPTSYVRAAYSTASSEDMNVALGRLASLLTEYQQTTRQ